jgi:membrane protein DedA with SNARE-associated domain
MFEWARSIVEGMGYPGVALLTFLENVFPPIPSELIIPLAGFVSADGDMTLGGVVIAGTLGSLVGAALWYEVGRRVGERRVRAWVDRSGHWLTLSASDIDRAQEWFRRHGGIAVFIGRLVPGVRSLISIPAGFARMPLLPFLLYSTIGTVAWTAGLAYAGVLLRENFAVVGDYVDIASYVVLAILGVMIVRRYVRCWPGRRSRQSQESGCA